MRWTSSLLATKRQGKPFFSPPSHDHSGTVMGWFSLVEGYFASHASQLGLTRASFISKFCFAGYTIQAFAHRTGMYPRSPWLLSRAFSTREGDDDGR
jgi:hypothetical protein